MSDVIYRPFTPTIYPPSFSPAPYVTPRRVRRFRLIGDSQTLGNGGIGNDATAYREPFYLALRSLCGDIEFRGNKVQGVAVGAGLFGGRNCLLPDYRSAATAGQTIAMASAQAAVSEALDGDADFSLVLAGTNDIALYLAGLGQDACVAAMLADMLALVQARLAANPLGVVFVLSLCPWVPPAVGYAAKNAARLAFNAALPAMCAAADSAGRCVFVDAGGLLSTAHMDSSGNHPNGDGYNLIGRAAADAVVQAARGPFGPRLPRNIRRLAKRPALKTTTNAAGELATWAANAGISPTGYVSCTFGIRFRPSDLADVNQTQIVGSYDPGATDFWFINVAGGASHYVQGWIGHVGSSGVPLAVESALSVDKSHMIVLSADASTGLVQLWCMREGTDGRACTMGHAADYAAAPWNLTPEDVHIGNTAFHHGSIGTYNDFWCANGYAATAVDVERWYYDGMLPEHVTGRYTLAEGSGTSLAPDPGFDSLPTGVMSGGITWSATGAVATPWDFGGDG